MSRPLIHLLLACAAAMFASRELPAQDLSGYLKNFSIGFRMPPGLAAYDSLWQVSHRVRLRYQHGFGKSLGFDAAWELSPRFQHAALFQINPFGFPINPASYRIVDPEPRPYPCGDCPKGRFGLYQNPDRLAVTWKSSKADVTLGRQAIAWGSARVINPTDVIAPFAFNDLDKEDAYGVDALRIRIPTGRLSEMDIGYLPGRHFDFHQGALFIRSRMNLRRTDVVLSLGGFRDHLLLGIDVSRSLGQMGFNLEAAYVDAGIFGEFTHGGRYARLSAGLDRSLSSRLYGFVEYHYNSAGANDPENYSRLSDRPAYRAGNVYLLGRHYLSIGGNLQATPLQELRVLVISNICDGSLSISPSWEFNVTTNSYLAAGAGIGIGKGPSLLLARAMRFNSEFGAYLEMLYASFRYYF